jgi:hypothetical protein
MRLKCFTAGIALLIAVVIWQVRADEESRAKKKKTTSSENAALIEHGKYLVNEVAQCSHCHTAHDAKGQMVRSRLLQGATLDFAPRRRADNGPTTHRTLLPAAWPANGAKKR